MRPKLLSLVGRSGSGKTTLITKLIPLFVKRGLKTGSIKHTHHDVTFDHPGKDSWKHRDAGSSQVLLLGGEHLALFGENQQKMRLTELSEKWFSDFDLVISEGFKNEECLKIEVTRQETHKPPLYTDPAFKIDAIASDRPVSSTLPVFNINHTEEIYAWICQKLKI